MDTPTAPSAAVDPAKPVPPAGLGCGALVAAALIVFAYAMYKYQQSAASEAAEPEALAAPPASLDRPLGPPTLPSAL
jgi:hypothetical protein